MEMYRVAILGASGHGKVLLDSLFNSSNINPDSIEVVYFLDDDKNKIGKKILGVEVIGPISKLGSLAEKFDITHFIVGIGNNVIRADIFLKSKEIGLKPITIVNKFSYVSPNSKIGDGTFIAPGAVVGVNAHIGDNVIVNTGASVDHDCLIMSHSTVNPGAVVAGSVIVEPFSYVHSGAVVIQNIRIGYNTIVGAGAVVINDLDPNGVYVGIPAKFLKPNDKIQNEKLLKVIKESIG